MLLVVALNMKIENRRGYKLPSHRLWSPTRFILVSSKWRKFVTCNITYHYVSCFKDRSGTPVRQVPRTEHMSLKKKSCGP